MRLTLYEVPPKVRQKTFGGTSLLVQSVHKTRNYAHFGRFSIDCSHKKVRSVQNSVFYAYFGQARGKGRPIPLQDG